MGTSDGVSSGSPSRAQKGSRLARREDSAQTKSLQPVGWLPAAGGGFIFIIFVTRILLRWPASGLGAEGPSSSAARALWQLPLPGPGLPPPLIVPLK